MIPRPITRKRASCTSIAKLVPSSEEGSCASPIGGSSNNRNGTYSQRSNAGKRRIHDAGSGKIRKKCRNNGMNESAIKRATSST